MFRLRHLLILSLNDEFVIVAVTDGVVLSATIDDGMIPTVVGVAAAIINEVAATVVGGIIPVVVAVVTTGVIS